MENKQLVDSYYEGIDRHMNLYLKSDIFKGDFNYEKLEIGVYVEGGQSLQEVVGNFDDELSLIYKKEPMDDVSNLIDKYEVLQKLFKIIQAYYHEALHILQTFTLQACNEHIYWIRNFKDLEFTVFALNIAYGKTWSYGEKIIGNECWEWINTKENWINRQISKNSNLRQTINKNFTNLETRFLNTIDLVEGEAFAFQELTTNCIGNKIYNLIDDNSEYKKAYTYFKKQSNIDCERDSYLIFILLCHLSLKFGTSRYDGDTKTASAIFDFLLVKTEKYKTHYKSYLNNDILLDEADSWLSENAYQEKISIEEALEYKRIVFLINLIKEDVFSYFKNPLCAKPILHFDRKMEAIKLFLYGNFRGFDSLNYFALLIASPKNILTYFVNKVMDEAILDLETKSPNNKTITIEQDNLVFEIMNDFGKLLGGREVFCCKEHGITNKKRIIMKCSNNDSLRIRFKHLFGENIELFHIIKIQ